ncbi:MAG TPA: hypothetical protein VGM15_14260 [Burkholderiaceae bacterium]
MAALLIVSGRSGCEPPGGEDAPAVDAVRDGCQSVVFVNCPLTRQPAAAGALRVTRQNLDVRRLKQGPTPASSNAIEITAERPTEAPPDPWEGFRQSMSSAAAPDCFAPSMQGGLLRLPYLLYAAAAEKCR